MAAAAPLAQSATIRDSQEKGREGNRGGIECSRTGGRGCRRRREAVGIGDVDLRGVMEDFFLDGEFVGIGQLESVGAEELDAVVLPGIVRGGDDNARVEAVSTREERHGRRGDDARAFDAAPASRNPAARVAAIHGLDSRVSRPKRTFGSRQVLRSEWPRARPTAKMVVGRAELGRRRRECRRCRRVCVVVAAHDFDFLILWPWILGCSIRRGCEGAVGEPRRERSPDATWAADRTTELSAVENQRVAAVENGERR